MRQWRMGSDANLLVAAPSDSEKRLPTWFFEKDSHGEDFIVDNVAAGL